MRAYLQPLALVSYLVLTLAVIVHMLLAAADPIYYLFGPDLSMGLLKGLQAATCVTSGAVAMAYAPYIWDNFRRREQHGDTWFLIMWITVAWWATLDTNLYSSLNYLFTEREPIVGVKSSVPVTGRVIWYVALTLAGTGHLAGALRRKWPKNLTFMWWSFLNVLFVVAGLIFG